MLLEKWHKKQHMRRIWTGTGKNEVRFQSMDEITAESKIKLLTPRVDEAERGGGDEDEEDKCAGIGKFKTVVAIEYLLIQYGIINMLTFNVFLIA